MGFRLHCATTYKVEWGNAIGFNHKVQEFHDLLDACCCDYSGEEFDVDLEVHEDDDTWYSFHEFIEDREG